MFVKFRHGVFELTAQLQDIRTIVFEDPNCVALIGQDAFFMGLVNNQILHLVVMNQQNNQMWSLPRSRLGSGDSVSSI